ncbi:MAG: beta-galactosidase, partial [Bryobacterales bacterium]|nr:beta-galactosidase [Bryobacterales bacterium]
PSMLLPPPEFVRHGRVDGAKLRSIEILLPERQSNPAIQVSSVVAQGLPAPYRDWPAAKVFPFVDEYGQYIHRTWETKIQGSRDFPKRLREEDRDLASHQRPTSWNRYGGWEKGPRREASGFFRTEKIDGRWWFVDPEGRLFWSHGVVRVGTRIRVGGVYHGTPLLDRENFFRLPAKDSPLGAFYGTQPQSTRGYYLGKHDHAVYDFLEANLFRKYGANWREAYAARAQRRLANWGLNSIANSSDPVIYLKRQTPYTAIVYSAPLGGNEHRIEASGGAWGRLPDPFDPGWRALMDRTLQTELKESLGDPWCLGFFVDNELHWGEPHHLAEVVLASPARQPAKQAFLAELKTKYSGIAELSRSWSKNYASWDEFLSRTDLPDRKLAPVRADLEAFSARVADTYFRGCRDAIKKASPRHMYLGCRFAGSNPMILRTASQYCDIVSMNRYAHVVQDLALPPDVDRPIVIGEFHFGAMDAPSFATANGPGWCANQNDRERAYRVYVESALRNPAIIGTHWFQFYDQPMSGRFDGENFNAGLLDICDTPYPEIVNACRRVAAKLYEYRSGMLA